MKTNKILPVFIFCGLFLLPLCRELPREMAIKTGTITNVEMKSASASGYLIDAGDNPVQYGHCYSKTEGVTADCTRTELGIPAATGGFISNLTGLEAGCAYYIKAYITDGKKTAYGEEISFTTDPAFLPEVITADVTSLTTVSAMSGGNITSDGGAVVTERGLCWIIENSNPSVNPTVEDDHTSDGSGTGSFISSITGLNPGTGYKVRAFATNKSGTAYGNIIGFKTNSVTPILETTPITSLGSTSAVCGGNITFDGGEKVTLRGVCWGTSQNPTTADNTTNDGSEAGLYTSDLTGLLPNTVYYVRAYATNIIGTSYGNQVSFKTYTGSVTDYDGNIYNTITIGAQIWFRENLKVTHYRNGDAIPNTTDSYAWIHDSTAAYCWYNNDIANKETFGAFYNYYVIENTSGICPAGWHVPSNAEFTTMVNAIGPGNVAGGMLKDTTLWTSPNSGATNSSGFTALPTGCRGYDDAHFHSLGTTTWFWTSTLDWQSVPIVYFLVNNSAIITSYSNVKRDGFSIRCVKD